MATCSALYTQYILLYYYVNTDSKTVWVSTRHDAVLPIPNKLSNFRGRSTFSKKGAYSKGHNVRREHKKVWIILMHGNTKGRGGASGSD